MTVTQQALGCLRTYAEVSIAYWVETEFVATPIPMGGWELTEVRVPEPYRKDYDAQKDGHPVEWVDTFPTRKWTELSAWQDSHRIGGAVLVGPESRPWVEMLEGRPDLGLIWDLRVSPEYRGQGVGKALMNAAIAWAKSLGLSELKVETQNVNVPACRFYRGRGFKLREVNPCAYRDLPHEVQLLWYLVLPGSQP